MGSDGTRSKHAAGGRSGRGGRNTTNAVKAYGEELEPIQPQDLVDPNATGAQIAGEIDGFHQPTAMFDKGQFLGELAELQDGGPDTRAAIAAEAEPPKGCRLIIVAGPDLGLEWSFKQPEIIMGRDEEAAVMLQDISVSRHHAKVVLEGNSFFLEDMGSGNGTFLNGSRVEREELSPGDEIVIGERTIRFVELNEAPATAAAHPVPPVGSEPEVGDVPPPSEEGDFQPLGGASQINVEAAKSRVEPALGDSPKVDAGPKVPQRGRALRTVVKALVGVTLLGVAVVGGWLLYNRYAGETAEEAQARARRYFLQSVELVKARRCGDAILLLNRVLDITPEYQRAAIYKAHCQSQVTVFKQVESARKLAQAGRFVAAIETLEKVDAKSDYGEEAEALKASYNRSIAVGLVEEARRKYENNELEAALDLVARALEVDTNLATARALLDDIEAVKSKPAPKRKVRRRKPSFRIPPQMVRAVAIYKNGQIGAAIDAARAAGGSQATTYVDRMKRVKKLLASASSAHRKKAAGELIRIVPAALELDKKISGRDGKVRAKLRRYYADGLYLKGIAAYQRKSYSSAYEYLNEALKMRPEHKLAQTRMSELARKAHEIYYQGYVVKDSEPAEARKYFRKVVRMTRPSNQYHKKAKKMLRALGS